MESLMLHFYVAFLFRLAFSFASGSLLNETVSVLIENMEKKTVQSDEADPEYGVTDMIRTITIEGQNFPEYYTSSKRLVQGWATTLEAEAIKDQISVVDLACSPNVLRNAVKKGCREGFFQVVNHGIPVHLLKTASRQAKTFFSLPTEEKYTCNTEAKGRVKFVPVRTGEQRDVLKVHYAPESSIAMDNWPLQPAGFKETMKEYITKQEKLAFRLLEVISESLGLQANYIATECLDPEILLAVNHYPPCLDPTKSIGIRGHSDACTLSIGLHGDVEGFQIYKEGQWVDVKPLEDALFVNLGDHLQILTNGRYESCLHRVLINKYKSRTSATLFVGPARSICVKPAPALIDKDHPALYRQFVYGDFLKSYF